MKPSPNRLPLQKKIKDTSFVRSKFRNDNGDAKKTSSKKLKDILDFKCTEMITTFHPGWSQDFIKTLQPLGTTNHLRNESVEEKNEQYMLRYTVHQQELWQTSTTFLQWHERQTYDDLFVSGLTRKIQAQSSKNGLHDRNKDLMNMFVINEEQSVHYQGKHCQKDTAEDAWLLIALKQIVYIFDIVHTLLLFLQFVRFPSIIRSWILNLQTPQKTLQQTTSSSKSTECNLEWKLKRIKEFNL